MLRRRHRGIVGGHEVARDQERKAAELPSRSGQRLSPDDIARIVNDRSNFHAGLAPVRHFKR